MRQGLLVCPPVQISPLNRHTGPAENGLACLFHVLSMDLGAEVIFPTK